MQLSSLRLPAQDLAEIIEAIGPRWERLRGQRLLLTGGTGFIGKWLLGSFLQANREFGLGATVLVVSRRPAAFLNQFSELVDAPGIEWVESDVRDLTLNEPCCYAIHAATDVVATTTPADILDTCIAGTSRVLAALGNTGPRRVLLLSSGAVYGRTPGDLARIPEDWIGGPDPLTPASAYGEGKRISELLCSIAASCSPGLEVAIARCFAFIGPHLPLDKHFAIGNFISAALRKQDIHIAGDGTPQRSYLYAGELTYWLWKLLFDAPNARAYNVGGTESLSIANLAQRVNTVLHPLGQVHIAKRPTPGATAQVYVPALERIAGELGLVPSIGLDDAIARTALWAREQLSLS